MSPRRSHGSSAITSEMSVQCERIKALREWVVDIRAITGQNALGPGDGELLDWRGRNVRCIILQPDFSSSSLSRWFTLCLPCVVPLSSVGVPADRDGTRVHDTPWKHRIHGRDAPRHCQPDAAIEIGIRGIAAHEESSDRI